MQNHSPDRLEIFLALALKSGAKQPSAAESFMPSAENLSTASDASDDAAREIFAAIDDYLSEKEAEQFKRLRTNHQNKSEPEKADWQAAILRKIGTDEPLIDTTIHWSYVTAALQKEIPAVQEIIFNFLPPAHKKAVNSPVIKARKNNQSKPNALEKTVHRAFARQFVALRDLPQPTAFDRLDGAQTARLIRLTGIREVALACLQIEAVESVAAFLRLFSAEDARAIAAQLGSAARMSDARLAFAENLVHTAMEIERQPSAMLDLLGIRLIGVLLCNCRAERVSYTRQKLPLEVAPQLTEIIKEQCLLTPSDLLSEISAEVESLAQKIFRRANDKKSAEKHRN